MLCGYRCKEWDQARTAECVNFVSNVLCLNAGAEKRATMLALLDDFFTMLLGQDHVRRVLKGGFLILSHHLTAEQQEVVHGRLKNNRFVRLLHSNAGDIWSSCAHPWVCGKALKAVARRFIRNFDEIDWCKVASDVNTQNGAMRTTTRFWYRVYSWNGLDYTKAQEWVMSYRLGELCQSLRPKFEKLVLSPCVFGLIDTAVLLPRELVSLVQSYVIDPAASAAHLSSARRLLSANGRVNRLSDVQYRQMQMARSRFWFDLDEAEELQFCVEQVKRLMDPLLVQCESTETESGSHTDTEGTRYTALRQWLRQKKPSETSVSVSADERTAWEREWHLIATILEPLHPYLQRDPFTLYLPDWYVSARATNFACFDRALVSSDSASD